MTKRDRQTVLIISLLAAFIAVGGAFYRHRVNVVWVIQNEASTYADTLLNGDRPFVISFVDATGTMRRRKVAVPTRQYLAVYDTHGHLLRWEEQDTLYTRDSSSGCFTSMAGENYAERLYLPQIPVAGARHATIVHTAHAQRMTWQTPNGAPGGRQTNTLVLSLGGRVYLYHYAGASGRPAFRSGTYVFSYPERVRRRAPPSRNLCS